MEDPEYYYIVVNYMKSYYERVVENNSRFSSALGHMKNAQASSRLVAEAYDSAKEILMDVFTPIIDIYILLRLREKKHVIILVGANHASNLSWYFRQTDDRGKYIMWMAPGTLDDPPCIDTSSEPDEQYNWKFPTRKQRFRGVKNAK